MSIINLRIDNIHYMHSRIRDRFTGNGRLIMDVYRELSEDITRIHSIPLIKVYYLRCVKDGTYKYYSENNRRLYLFKLLADAGYLETIQVRLVEATGKLKWQLTHNIYSLTARMQNAI